MTPSDLLRDLAICFGVFGLVCLLGAGLEAMSFVVRLATRGKDEEARQDV